MRRFVLFLVFNIFFFTLFTKASIAVVNPLNVPNNRFGIHILFPDEIGTAAKLVNTTGGDWGYVTVPIQAGDKNLIKWQLFMEKAKLLHIIPILRLATEGDYFNTTLWRKPDASDVLDFANFLNSLDWPTKNRYVVIFNEVNRADEWGGAASPTEYADILYYSSLVFKERNPDFFVISAGLDNAAPNNGTLFINQYNFLQQMHAFLPTVFDNVDGMSSHSYPNPGFAQPPSTLTRTGTGSFIFEQSLVESLTGKKLPVFITETGWSNDIIPQETSSVFYSQAFSSVWNNESVVAVTPFLLEAGHGSFTQFSFLDNGAPNIIYNTIAGLSKTKGQPIMSESKNIFNISSETLGETTTKKYSSQTEGKDEQIVMPKILKSALKWLLKL